MLQQTDCFLPLDLNSLIHFLSENILSPSIKLITWSNSIHAPSLDAKRYRGPFFFLILQGKVSEHIQLDEYVSKMSIQAKLFLPTVSSLRGDIFKMLSVPQ